MNDARFDRSRTGDATGDATPVSGTHDVPDAHDVVPSRDWTRRRREPSDTSLLVHWVDETGSVVRLISSTSDQRPERGS